MFLVETNQENNKFKENKRKTYVHLTHMETRLYNCEYCRIDFLPTRRKVQKFCSNSCRSKSHHQKTKKGNKLPALNLEAKPSKISIDKMSFAGVGNAAAGKLAVEVIKSIFISEENKPATKGDLKQITKRLERYQKIKNMTPNQFGHSPFFDNKLEILVYLKL